MRKRLAGVGAGREADWLWRAPKDSQEAFRGEEYHAAGIGYKYALTPIGGVEELVAPTTIFAS